MTDIAAPRNAALARKLQSDAAMIRRRYAAERRFKSYGVIAIALTAVFLVVLFADILRKGIPAFTEHTLGLSLMADQAALDPQGARDLKALLSADYDSLIRDKLRELFPGATSRADRKALNGLLSSGAADDFRSMIASDPSLIGTEVQVPVLLSDDADQFLKGYQTGIVRTSGAGTLTITPDGDNFLLASSTRDFAAALQRAKRFVTEELTRSRKEYERIAAAAAGKADELKLAETRLETATQANDATAIAQATTERDSIKAELDGLLSNEATLKAKVEALQARLAESDSAETLDPGLPSVIIWADGGAFKVTELDEQSARAVALIPPKGTASAAPGSWTLEQLTTPEANRRVSDQEAVWLQSLETQGLVHSGIAWRFFTSGDSREPELAGIRGALVGSILTLLVTLILCLPIGVAAAIYLEEFAPKNRLTHIIEVNINNLAAVPSIVFGLLGLAMFLNFFGLPRSAPLVGGLVLALLVLPTIIIASRAALKAVPPSIKEAALGVGASKQQAIFHHILPLAMPGIMTGTIIGMAHALGETAPLLMIGMVAFIVDIPGGITDAATALPVQIYLWSDLPEVAFQAKTAAAIIVLLVFLFVMNAAAIVLRKRFERRW
ncbi:MAG: phosphate ABC transporter permease PstA [Rhizobiales bacterium]|nr:phosphate ABC transporter permease PstA [Hyphomicrobiales bacterium]